MIFSIKTASLFCSNFVGQLVYDLWFQGCNNNVNLIIKLIHMNHTYTIIIIIIMFVKIVEFLERGRD